MAVLVKAQRIIDGTGRPPIVGGGVLINDDRIVQVGKVSQADAPAGTKVIDLGKWTVLPGLIDVHSHLAKAAEGNEEEQVRQSDATIAIQSTQYARMSLASGVTTMRTVGEVRFLDVAYKKAIEAGTMLGPRVLISGQPLVCSSDLGVFSGVVASSDGPVEVRKAVRANIRAGADLIKMFATGGGLYREKPRPAQATFTMEEIQAAVEVAHSFGKKVAVHAVSGLGIDYAIEAGVDTIDHGHFLTDEQAALMAKHGTALVSTVIVHTYPTNFPDRIDRTAYPALKEYSAMVTKIAGQHIKKAKQHGVPFTFGSDAMHGLMWYEFYCGVRYAGLSTMEALTAGTKTAAQVCGVGDETGTLESGKWADLIAVEEDPLENIEALSQVRFVMKAGQSYDPATLV